MWYDKIGRFKRNSKIFWLDLTCETLWIFVVFFIHLCAIFTFSAHPLLFSLFQLTPWWLHEAYLSARTPLPVVTSPGITFPHFPTDGSVDAQLECAAKIIQAALKYHHIILRWGKKEKFYNNLMSFHRLMSMVLRCFVNIKCCCEFSSIIIIGMRCRWIGDLAECPSTWASTSWCSAQLGCPDGAKTPSGTGATRRRGPNTFWSHGTGM